MIMCGGGGGHTSQWWKFVCYGTTTIDVSISGNVYSVLVVVADLKMLEIS